MEIVPGPRPGTAAALPGAGTAPLSAERPPPLDAPLPGVALVPPAPAPAAPGASVADDEAAGSPPAAAASVDDAFPRLVAACFDVEPHAAARKARTTTTAAVRLLNSPSRKARRRSSR